MEKNVLRHKMAHIVMLLAGHLHVSEEEALDLFFSTRTYALLAAGRGGLHLLSDYEL
ncbi:MAG: DUF3791 domain-containing protein [Bacteroidales bacterium]|nr:DUF3791 domain-containing protein [Bacteroidales bacterium]